MAIAAPLIRYPDGSGYSTSIQFSSNIQQHFFTGTVESSAIDVQVQIRGGGFVSDPMLVKLALPNFTIPNSDNYPAGLSLFPGDNQIDVRAIDLNGNVSPISTVIVRYVTDSELSLQVTQPTGIELLRNKDSITLKVHENPEPEVVGYNFYAAKESGGMVSGYYKLNKALVQVPDSILEDTTFAQDNITYTHNNGKLRLQLSEVDQNNVFVQDILDTNIDLTGTGADQIFSYTISDKIGTDYYSFLHNRNNTDAQGTTNNDQFVNVPADEPLYYVITAVGYNSANREYVESRYSSEFVGQPLIIDTTIKDMTPRSRNDIVLSMMSNIQKVNPTVSLIPGSSTRDISIDPQSSELERISFIADFTHRSQSFLTLMALDDANGDGVSDPVASSQYKRSLKNAFGYVRDEDAQTLIDNAFDKLAGDFMTLRRGAQYAIGTMFFYTTVKPTRDMTVNQGDIVGTTADATLNIPSVTFQATSQVVMKYNTVESYYDASKKWWGLYCNVRAVTAGSDSNRPANQINRVVSGAAGFQVLNLTPTKWGTDIETNRSLAERAMLALASVDSGTATGYLATALKVSGVQEAQIISAADTMMMRDWDDLREKHIGGKVDVWVKGLYEQEVSDNFSFVFQIANNMRFNVIDVGTLTFRSTDTRLSTDNPLAEMLDNPTKGYGFRNVTKGLDFNLSGYTILDYRTVRLSNTVTQPALDIDDIVTGDYRFQSSNLFTPTRQPVRRVVSIVGESSGSLDPDHGFVLYKLEDPLLYGESTKANDYLKIVRYNGIPSGAVVLVNDERHVLVGSRQEALDSIGVDTTSIRVFNVDRTVEYNGPEALNPDFLIVAGMATTPAKIVRVVTGTITNGQEVSVDYEHDENFTVRYVVNSLLDTVQEAINKKSHATADVLVKQAIENAIDLENTLVLHSGADRSLADSQVRTNVAQEIDNRPIGGGGRQSDLIRAEEVVSGVDYVVVPFSKMAWADGSLILRDPLLSDYLEMTSLNQGTNIVYLLIESLSSSTLDNGGDVARHRGVFQDDQPLVFATSLSTVGITAGLAYIIGQDGAAILGYSDDATLLAEGFSTDELVVERKRLTANRVVVSMSSLTSDLPSDHAYTSTYVVSGDSGAKDIVTSPLSVITLGSFNIIYGAE